MSQPLLLSFLAGGAVGVMLTLLGVLLWLAITDSTIDID